MSERRGPDLVLLLTLGLLLLTGFSFVFSSSYLAGEQHAGDPFHYFKRQVLAFAMGAVAFTFAFKLNYQRILAHPRTERVVPWLPVVAYAVLLLVYVPGLGRMVSGSHRWIDLRLIQVQVSEVAKVLLLCYLAYTLPRKAEQLHDFRRGFLPSLVWVLVAVGLIALEPDLSTALLTFSVLLFLFYLAGTPPLFLATVLAGLVPLVVGLMQLKPYMATRLLFFNPWLDPWGRGYHLLQSFTAFRNGGLLGVGPGNSAQKLGKLPEAHTDFVYSVIGEELGLVGGAFVLCLFGLFALRGMRAALRQVDPRLLLLGAGATAFITVQALLNVSVTLGLMPTSGLPLPFISYGRSDLVMKCLLAGVLAGLSRTNHPQEGGAAFGAFGPRPAFFRHG